MSKSRRDKDTVNIKRKREVIGCLSFAVFVAGAYSPEMTEIATPVQMPVGSRLGLSGRKFAMDARARPTIRPCSARRYRAFFIHAE